MRSTSKGCSCPRGREADAEEVFGGLGVERPRLQGHVLGQAVGDDAERGEARAGVAGQHATGGGVRPLRTFQ